MSYSFDVLGITPIFTFFNYQQKVEQNPQRSTAYLGSYHCSLEGFIQATEMIHQKTDWDWDDVVKQIIHFWLGHEENIQEWKKELTTIGQESLIVARVANIDGLRRDFEFLI